MDGLATVSVRSHRKPRATRKREHSGSWPSRSPVVRESRSMPAEPFVLRCLQADAAR